VLELLAVVPFLAAIPALFHELAHSALLHARLPDTIDVALGASEMLPAVAILPFMIYQLSGFGTLHFIVSKTMNWVINIGILVLIVAAYIANREGQYHVERMLSSLLVIAMAITVYYGVLELRKMQAIYDVRCPPKASK